MCCALIWRGPDTHSFIEYKKSLCRSNESHGETTHEYKIAALVLPKHYFNCVLCVVILKRFPPSAATPKIGGQLNRVQPLLCIIYVD